MDPEEVGDRDDDTPMDAAAQAAAQAAAAAAKKAAALAERKRRDIIAQRKRRHMLDDESDYDQSEGEEEQQEEEQETEQTLAAAAREPDDDDGEEEVEILDSSVGWARDSREKSAAARARQKAGTAATRAPAASGANPAAKRIRLTFAGAKKSGGAGGRSSPTAPMAEPLSPPHSPVAPATSPVVRGMAAASYPASTASETREELAVRRALQAKAAKAAKLQAAAAAAAPPAASPASFLPSAAAAASAPASGSNQIRRRKAPSAAAPSSMGASASLVSSFTGLNGETLVTPSRLPPELLWHADNNVLVPANAADRVDVERTFLQQILAWDPFTPSVASRAGVPTDKLKAMLPREMQSFAKFLDLSVPLPVHFTSPQAYLGYFGPIVLDNFRAQMTQSFALQVAEMRRPKLPKGAPAPAEPPKLVQTLVGGSGQHRTTWTVLSVSPCLTLAGGGDDWFEVRLKIAHAHRSMSELCGADIVAIGIDEPVDPAAKPAHAAGPQPALPPPSPATLFAFAFLDGGVFQPECVARLRMYLPGVSSSMSSYVSTASAGSVTRNRFQLLYNRLQAACAAAANPLSAGGANPNANFTKLGPQNGRNASDGPAQPQFAYLTKLETTVTSMREYTALVKVACLLPLRLQHELLTPSAADHQSDSDDESGATAGQQRQPIDVSSPANSDDESGPPALESLDQVAKASIKRKRKAPAGAASATPGSIQPAPRMHRSLSYQDSTAWVGLPSGFREFLHSTLNKHQLRAVQVALKRYQTPGFTLLQGPPGTGKSKTVVALLNALHLGAFQRHYDSVLTSVTHNQTAMSKPRILVCAPSNTAVDELIMRVLESGLQHKPLPGMDSSKPALSGKGGFVDGNRVRYVPSIVRVGQSDSIRPELRNVISLDALVDTYQRLPEESLLSRLNQAKEFTRKQEVLLGEYRTVYIKSQRVTNEMKATLDQLAALGHDVTKQAQHAQYKQLISEQLGHTKNMMHTHEKVVAGRLDVARCEWALLTKQAGRAASAGGGGAGNLRKDRDAALDALRISFLNQAHIVFCTLSGSGVELLSKLDHPFQALIVDEAAQCTEIAALIPLTHDVQHCVLVGDPRQLPATVFSQDAAAKRMWERSLFERLEQSGHQMHALTTQYRMHSDIRQFPSDYFYSGLLTDADYIREGSLYRKPYHANANFQPLLFFDLQSAAARGSDPSDEGNRSLGNVIEAGVVVNLLAALVAQYGEAINTRQIGVITFYQKQKLILQDQLRRRAGVEAPHPTHGKHHNQNSNAPAAAASSSSAAAASSAAASASASSSAPRAAGGIVGLEHVEVSTVDGFQGREKDIILVSCVRGGSSGGLGFVDDVRRMNVALTRAKFACWVVGDSRALRKSPHWSAFLDSATKRGRYVNVQPGTDFTAPPKQQQLPAQPQNRPMLQHQPQQQQQQRLSPQPLEPQRLPPPPRSQPQPPPQSHYPPGSAFPPPPPSQLHQPPPPQQLQPIQPAGFAVVNLPAAQAGMQPQPPQHPLNFPPPPPPSMAYPPMPPLPVDPRVQTQQINNRQDDAVRKLRGALLDC